MAQMKYYDDSTDTWVPVTESNPIPVSSSGGSVSSAEVTTEQFTITPAEAIAGSLVERTVTNQSGKVARLLSARIEVPGITGAAAETLHGVGIGWKHNDLWVESFAVEADATVEIGYSQGFEGHPDDTYFVGGGFENIKGTSATPIMVYYSNGSDLAQVGDVIITLVVSYDSR